MLMELISRNLLFMKLERYIFCYKKVNRRKWHQAKKVRLIEASDWLIIVNSQSGALIFKSAAYY